MPNCIARCVTYCGDGASMPLGPLTIGGILPLPFIIYMPLCIISGVKVRSRLQYTQLFSPCLK